jgi:exodeoxyribonuclease V alpha subunit
MSIAEAIKCLPGVPFIAEATNRICDRYAAPDETLRVVLFLLLARAQDGHLQLGNSSDAIASVKGQLNEWSKQVLGDQQHPDDRSVTVSEWLNALAEWWPSPLENAFPEHLIVKTDKGLQLRRFHHIETTMEQAIIERLVGDAINDNDAWQSAVAEAIADMSSRNTIDLAPEQRAAVAAASRKLLIITGGPGTGKTTVIASILDAWKRFATKSGKDIRVALAAPTARAATRITAAIGKYQVDSTAAMTVHRLLGSRPDQHNAYYYNQRNPLELDVLIIDEVSMLDAGLMDALLQAMPVDACLILVGDPNQLPSVEAGTVLQDLMSLQTNADTNNPVVTLKRNQRATTELSELADAILSGNTDIARQKLGNRLQDDISPNGTLRHPENMWKQLAQFRPTMAGPKRFLCTEALLDTADELFKELGKWQIICPLRRQVTAINQQFDAFTYPDAITPIIVTRNNYALELMNGEIGFSAWVGNELYAAFEPLLTLNKDGQLVKGPIRLLPYASLTDIDKAYAITVHKSQGSEWGTVDIVLPPEPHRLCTRELIYTAITRARHNISIVGNEISLTATIQTHTFRDSNLGNRLTNALRRLTG